MLIRSQDKTLLANMDRVNVVYVSGRNIKAFYSEIDIDILGVYSTHEKAIKVLDMVQDMYLSRMELDGGYDMISKSYVQSNYWVLPKVFVMPADEEVD